MKTFSYSPPQRFLFCISLERPCAINALHFPSRAFVSLLVVRKLRRRSGHFSWFKGRFCASELRWLAVNTSRQEIFRSCWGSCSPKTPVFPTTAKRFYIRVVPPNHLLIVRCILSIRTPLRERSYAEGRPLASYHPQTATTVQPVQLSPIWPTSCRHLSR